jgi:hypothetical protein
LILANEKNFSIAKQISLTALFYFRSSCQDSCVIVMRSSELFPYDPDPPGLLLNRPVHQAENMRFRRKEKSGV